MKIGLVATTIGNGDFLCGYCPQAKDEGLKGAVTFYVIPDVKTSRDMYREWAIHSQLGYDVRCPDLTTQEEFLRRFGVWGSSVPLNTDYRRNVGYLMALQDGCDVIISIDDDNYCIPGKSYFMEHALVACETQQRLATMHADTGWYNICSHLGLDVYPRGFPPGKEPFSTEVVEETGQVRVNAGLWIGDPDLDADTWLKHSGLKALRHDGTSFMLGKGTWSPINSQNTAVHRDLLVAYYFIPMGSIVDGRVVDRYGDIFQGYFLEACVEKMGDRIRVGTPVVNHKRNSHNYILDHRKESACAEMLPELLGFLKEVKLSGHTYSQVYQDLSFQLEDAVEKFKGSIWSPDAKGYFHRVAFFMRKWIDVCTMVGIGEKEHVQSV